MHTNTQDEESSSGDIKDCVVDFRSNDNVSLTPDNTNDTKKDYTWENYYFNGETNSHSRQGGTLSEEAEQYEPEQSNNHSGTAREDLIDNCGGGAGEEGELLTVGQVIEHFVMKNQARHLREPTIQSYSSQFVSFVMSFTGMEENRREEAIKVKVDRRKLASSRGKKYLMDFIGKKAPTAQRFCIAALKTVWMSGLDLPWPIDTRTEFRLPRVRREQSPGDSIIKEWTEAVSKDPDIYFKMIFMLLAQHGWRPSHLAHIKWRNVQYDDKGKPIAIVAYGGQEKFKTESPIVARLAPGVQEILIQWANLEFVKEARTEDGVIIPTRDRWGYHFKEFENRLFIQHLHRNWEAFRSRWKLPALKPKALRHWVATICRKAQLSKQASAFLMGHDAAQGGAMRDWYDNPQFEDVFAEQAERLPFGPLGAFRPPAVEVVDDVPAEALELYRAHWKGQIGDFDLCHRIGPLKTKSNALVVLKDGV